jgi:hypothetical protein
VVDQNAPHETRGQRQEVRAILPAYATKIDQSNEGFVDERGCLQRVIVTLATHLETGEAPQFLVDDRNQLIERGPIAPPPGEQQLGHMRTRPIRRRRACGHRSVWSLHL